MTTIIDYGVGNLFSLKKSLEFIGEDVAVTDDAQAIKDAGRLILPGVGAFGDAAALLKERGFDLIIKEKAAAGTPILGICLGMQLLFDSSCEYGTHEGLGLIPGEIEAFDGKIPQIGWNALRFGNKDGCPIFSSTKEGDCVYFVHSFFAPAGPYTAAKAEYGIEFSAAVQRDNVFGCQFHPEKSGPVGLEILKAFCAIGEKV